LQGGCCRYIDLSLADPAADYSPAVILTAETKTIPATATTAATAAAKLVAKPLSTDGAGDSTTMKSPGASES